MNTASSRALAPARRRPRRRRLHAAARYVGIVLVVLVFVLPLTWMVAASFQTNADIRAVDSLFVFNPTLTNYENVFGQGNYGLYIVNSFVVAAASTALSLLVGVPAGYALSRFTMHGSSITVLLARIIPGIALLVPWYYVFANLQIVGSYFVLVIANVFILLPVCVFIMTSFFDSIPVELEEAGLVDGLTHLQTFRKVALPLSIPGVATASILSFIFAWNNFLFPLVLADSTTKTLPVAVFDFVSYARVDWGGIMAATTVMTLPIIVIALFCQKYIVSGLTAGATKG